ncbi:MAG: porin [Vicinamibacterales bacterium]
MSSTHRWSTLPLVLLFAAAPLAVSAQEAVEAPDAEQEVDVFRGAGFLLFQTADGQFKWWLDGRMMLDTAAYMNSDNMLSNGAEIRRARLALNMQLWKNWASQFDVEYVTDNTIEIKDMWLGYTGVRNSIVKVGNFKEPFGLETLTSSRYISFIERSLIDNFSPDRRLGVAYATWGSHWQATGGVFGQAVGSTDATGDDQGYGFTGRVTAVPVKTNTTLIHLGLAGSYTTPNAATNATLSDIDSMRLRARPETHVNRGRFLDTGRIANVDHEKLLGIEAALSAGSFSAQGEYNTATFTRTLGTLPTPTFDGWYAYASWFPTGEHRPYNTAAGEFDRVQPTRSRGALELVARYSTADLNDPSANIFGGKQEITTLGTTWYANANVRLMVNYSFVNSDQYAKGDRSYKVNDDFNVLQARLALIF